ncbi:NAD-dependent epimerase/dehydratase family protein [Amycolatopsis sp. NPDC059021]|uniref:NAD-dependent epimerase/dehydratase family protein n=1 Tax=Amycolatopsis sp. NPDC059021 TaxID=3346704 RepID=UPI00366C75F7
MPRLLLFGGSWFLGRAVVASALETGWEVTIFRRGRAESGQDPDGVRVVHGDYADPRDLVRLAETGPFDAVVDNLAFTPRETLAAARALEPVTQRYVVVSSVSAYADWPWRPLTEESAVLECEPDAGPDPGYDGEPAPTTYGFGKAGCERAVLQTFGTSRSVVLRPGVILGPGEYVGRTAWWLARMRRGGRVLAPGHPDRVIQPIDVRDVAAFALRAPAGAFNVTAPGTETMGDFLTACTRFAPAPAGTDLVWVPDDFLLEQNLRQWTELPLWRTYAGAWRVDSARAREAGLTTRPIMTTVKDTAAWLASGRKLVASDRAAELGISSAKESEIIEEFEESLGTR